MNDDTAHWAELVPVDDFGNELHWSDSLRGINCMGAHGWCRTLVDVAYDNAE